MNILDVIENEVREQYKDYRIGVERMKSLIVCSKSIKEATKLAFKERIKQYGVLNQEKINFEEIDFKKWFSPVAGWLELSVDENQTGFIVKKLEE